MVKEGQLAPETQIVEEGGQDWRPIRDILAVTPRIPLTAKPTPEISTARKAAGWGCLSLLMVLGAVAMLSPATKDEPGAIVENAPAAKETLPPQAPIAAAKPQPASATLSEARKEAMPQDESLEYKLACIDAGHFLPDNAPILQEYRRVLSELSARFETSPERIGDMTGAVVNRIREKNGIESTMLEMMHAAEKATSNELHELMGKGANGYSSTLATLAILMIDAKKKETRR